MSGRGWEIRPHVPAMSRKMRDLDQMTGGLIPQSELRKLAADATYVNGELALGLDAARALIDYAPLDPVMKELRRAQFDELADTVREHYKKEGQ